MDTSETYIKMCEKAEEIQSHDYIDGDYVGYIKGRHNWGWAFNGQPQVELYYDGHHYDINRIEYCWLPRQDQLQEMVGNDWIETFDKFVWWVDGNFGSGADEFVFNECDRFYSMEQLWLAFVLKEKYNKTWNGDEWNINTQ